MPRILIVVFSVWLCASVAEASPGQKTKPRKSPPKVVEAQPQSAPAPQSEDEQRREGEQLAAGSKVPGWKADDSGAQFDHGRCTDRGQAKNRRGG